MSLTATVSGVLGMAGGLLLLGALLLVLPVTAAFVVHGLLQLVSNGRALLQRSHLRWRVVGWYALGPCSRPSSWRWEAGPVQADASFTSVTRWVGGHRHRRGLPGAGRPAGHLTGSALPAEAPVALSDVTLHPLLADADVQFERIDVPRGPLAALRCHTDGPGAPVLLVPGYTGSKEDFRLLLPPLASAGHPAVALDQRGQFQSPGPDDPHAYAVEELATDLLAVADRLSERAGGQPVHVVGHSFGGLVARAAVLRRPEAFRSLVLMGSGPAGLTGPRVALLPLMRPLLEQGMPTLVEAMDALNASDARFLSLDASVQGFLRDRMLASSAAGLLGMADGLTGEPDRVEELRESGVPVLVLHGQDDDAWPPSLQAEMAARLGAEHAVVPRAAHSPAVEHPQATLDALVGFFSRLP